MRAHRLFRIRLEVGLREGVFVEWRDAVFALCRHHQAVYRYMYEECLSLSRRECPMRRRWSALSFIGRVALSPIPDVELSYASVRPSLPHATFKHP